ncbi:MAG: GTP-binding protein [Promethearchaeota archaeon]
MNLKIIVVGDYKSGKTSIIKRYLQKKYQDDHIPTVGFEVSKIKLDVNGYETINIAIWDTGGLTSQIPPTKDKIFDHVDAALIIIEITNADIAKNIYKWYSEIKKSIDYDIPIYVIFSKSDLLINNRDLIEDEVKIIVEELKFSFFLVSAKIGENINESFTEIIRIILNDEIIKDFQASEGKSKKYANLNLNSLEIKALEDLENLIITNNTNQFNPTIRNLNELKQKGLPIIFEIDGISFGIKTKNGIIKGLGLFNCNLNTLPESFSNFRSLEKLTLRCNPLNRIPHSIFSLTSLEELDLSLTNLATISSSIQKLKCLKEIHLENNHLTILPEEIGKLKLLERLNLENNPLVNLPHSICDLESLREIYLEAPVIFYKGNLKKLPKNIGNLKNLEIINLSSCELKKLPLSFGNLLSLKVLDLYNNHLTSLPDSIGNLKLLEYLDLEENNLMSLPDAVGDLVNLKVIKLSNNSLQKKGSEKFKALAFKSKGTRYERLIKISEMVKIDETNEKQKEKILLKRRFNTLKPFIYAGLVAFIGLLTFLNIRFDFQSVNLILWGLFFVSLVTNLLIGTCIIATISKYFKISIRFYKHKFYKLFDIFVVIYLIWSIRAFIKITMSIELLPTVNILFDFTIPEWLLNIWAYIGYNINLTFLENIDLFFSHFYFKIFSTALVFWALYRNGLIHIRKTAFEEQHNKNYLFFLVLGLFGTFSLAIMNYSNLEPYLSIGYDCGVMIGGWLFIWDINNTSRMYFYYFIIVVIGGMVLTWFLYLVDLILSVIISIISIFIYFTLRRLQIKKASLFQY